MCISVRFGVTVGRQELQDSGKLAITPKESVEVLRAGTTRISIRAGNVLKAFNQKWHGRTGEVAQCLRALLALLGDQGSRGSGHLFSLLRAPGTTWCPDIHADKKKSHKFFKIIIPFCIL